MSDWTTSAKLLEARSTDMQKQLNRAKTILNNIRRMYIAIFSADKPLDADPEIYTTMIKMNNMLYEVKEIIDELKKADYKNQGKQLDEARE